MSEEKQISAYISRRTNERLDLFVRETGIKKGRVIEDALVRHLDAANALPADAVTPTRIVLTNDSFDFLVDDAECLRPTQALHALMRGRE